MTCLMRYGYGTWLIAVGLLSNCLIAPTLSEGSELDSVIEAWDRREQEVHAFQFSWSGVQFQVKGADPLVTVTDPLADKIPPADTSFDIQMSLAADRNGRVRLEYHGSIWSKEQNGYVPKATVHVFDGKQRQTFFPHGGRPFPRVFIEGDTLADMVRDTRVGPVRMVYRPFDEAMGMFDRSSLALTNQVGDVDGRECLVLRHSSEVFQESIWVDPSRAFVPVRYYLRYEGTIREQIEISYSPDEQYGWVPVSWNVAHLDEEGGVRISWSGTVTEHSLNQPIADSVFRITYPPGTWVRNYITDERYILREGDDKRPILPGEYDGENYEELLHSDPVSPSASNRWPLVVTTVICLVALVACVLLSLRRER